MKVPPSKFVEAIRNSYGCKATFLGQKAVREQFEGKTVWAGSVLVFELQDHPTAKTCYAWSVDNRVTTVLHEGPVDSPEAAVRAAIAAEHRCRHCGARLLRENHACLNCARSVNS